MLRHAAWALVGLALSGCGRDYFYVGHLEVEGDMLVVELFETCPAATLWWDGTFSEGPRIDVTVHALGADCSGAYKAFFDLRPARRALVASDPRAPGILLVRVPGFDADRGPDCALYDFSPTHPTWPGSGSSTKCP
jgi:hypothetical protein